MATTNNKAIFITGANGGIGSVLVPMLLERGWRVYAGVGPDNTLTANSQLVALALDVTNSASVEAAAQTVTQAQGAAGLQAVVNLAGIIIQGPMEIVPETELRRAFDVNVFGPVSVIQHFLPLVRAGHGRIVNITALMALASGPFFGPVASSKAALAFLSDSLRMELAPWHIPVINVIPSAMKTPVFQKAQAAFERTLGAVPQAKLQLYQPLIRGAAEALTKQQESDPKVAASVILKAIETPRPKARYFAGSSAVIAGHLLPFLPQRMRDTMLTSMVGGGKK